MVTGQVTQQVECHAADITAVQSLLRVRLAMASETAWLVGRERTPLTLVLLNSRSFAGCRRTLVSTVPADVLLTFLYGSV